MIGARAELAHDLHVGLGIDRGARDDLLESAACSVSRSADRARRGPAVVLKPARDRSVAQRHPWIFAGAVDRVMGNPASGDTVSVLSAGGEALALGALAGGVTYGIGRLFGVALG